MISLKQKTISVVFLIIMDLPGEIIFHHIKFSEDYTPSSASIIYVINLLTNNHMLMLLWFAAINITLAHLKKYYSKNTSVIIGYILRNDTNIHIFMIMSTLLIECLSMLMICVLVIDINYHETLSPLLYCICILSVPIISFIYLIIRNINNIIHILIRPRYYKNKDFKV